MSGMGFRVSLLRVNEQLSNQQLEHLKFLSRTVIPNARMDRIRQPLDLFSALEERGRLSPDNVDFLRLLLDSAACHDAQRELQGIPSVRMEPIEQDFLFRKCLLFIAVELSSTEFDSLKFTLKERLKQSTDRIYSATDLFQLLIQRQIITTFDLKVLYDLLYNMGRKDLSEVVNRYMQDAHRQSYQVLNQGGSIPTTLYTGGQHLPPPIEETPPTPHPPQFPTISSGTRTNPQSLASTLPSLSPGAGGRSVNTTLSSLQGTMNERGSGTNIFSPPPPMVDMRSMSGNSIDSSHPPATTVSGLDSHRSAVVHGNHIQGLPRQISHSSSQGQGMSNLEFRPGYYGQGYGPEQSPHTPAECNLLNRDPQQNKVQSPQPPPPNSPPYRHEPGPPPKNEVPFSSAQELFTFKLDEGVHQQVSQNQQLQKELALRDHELRTKVKDIERYERQLVEMHAHIDSVQDQQKGKELEYQQKITDLEDVLKRMTNEAERQRRDMQQLHHQLQLVNPRSTQDDGDFYEMNKTPHGVCLIINNHKFYHDDPAKCHPDRGGAEVDVHNLTQTFKYLCYRLEVVENLSSADMKAKMLEMANRDHSQYDSFVCCILTHGERDVVHGSDCEPVNLHDLAGVMKMCPTLRGTPKLFFIQACRGELESKGFDLPERDAGGPYSNTIPQEADFYFGFATPIGSSAYRSRRYGSWFISEVCQVFIKHAYTHDLGGMMTKVNKNVSDAYTKDGYKQSPESVDRLRFRVHFFRFLQSRGVIRGQ